MREEDREPIAFTDRNGERTWARGPLESGNRDATRSRERAPFPASAPAIDGSEPAVHGLLAVLESAGVDTLFGVPGGPLTALFEALRARGTIRFVLAKHEEGASLMATSYARASGRLAVCCATSGPGATNALTGVASAYTEGVPLLFLSGQVSTSVFGKGAIQESTPHGVDLVALFRPITKLSTMVPRGAVLASTAREAIRQAFAGRRGPVHLNLPCDVLSERVPRTTALPLERSLVVGAPVDVAAAKAAALRLAGSTRSCILAGSGVLQSGAHGELFALSERLAIPVATTPKGKGAFPEAHRLSLGVFGLGGHARANAWLGAGVDTLLVVGSALGEFASNSWDPCLRKSGALIQIDVDAAVIGRNYPVDLGVVGDARATLCRILDDLPESLPPRTPAASDPLRDLREAVPRWESTDGFTGDAAPIKPPRLVREIRDALPDDGMLFVDNGNSILWAGHFFEARRPGTYFIDLGMAGMGSAVAGILGGMLAAPGRPAVALVGDAAFAMNGMEVHTAVELGLPAIWVVVNNGGHGMVMQGETLLRGRHLGFAGFGTPLDIAGLATSLGAQAFRVHHPRDLRRALAQALESRRPTVIDAIVDGSVVPPTLLRRAQSLSRSFGAAGPRDGHASSGADVVGPR